jgi:hypothetical protein
MQKDIRFLLVFLIIVIGVLVWIQSYECNPVPNTGKLNITNTNEPFAINHVNNNQLKKNNHLNYINNINEDNTYEDNINYNQNELINNENFSKKKQEITSKIVDNILKNSESKNYNNKQKKYNNSHSEELNTNTNFNNEEYDDLSNPLMNDLNSDRNSLMDPEDSILDKLIKEVNTGNNLIVDNPKSELYRNKSKSKNSAKKYRKVSYKDSDYRYDFNEDGSQS